MDKDFFVRLYDYNFWADHKFFECIMALTDEQYRQNLDFSAGPIHNHAVHILAVEYWWIHFLKTGELDFPYEDNPPTTREDLRREWDKVEAQARAYVATLTPAELARTVKPSFWGDDEAPVTVWQALFQVVNHSMDHRTQALTMIYTQFGGPTFEQDFLNYLEETNG
ncbi:MAG: DinB family protein [Chloroflexi bacterium]|nr:DinB family protein [Chloroflexota bacterium]